MYYKHFTEKERETLYFYLLEWKKKKEIALLMYKHPSTIGREIKRNSILVDMKFNHNDIRKWIHENYHYLPNKAQMKYRKRKSEVWQMWAILKWYKIREKVAYYLKLGYSPPIISWVLKKRLIMKY